MVLVFKLEVALFSGRILYRKRKHLRAAVDQRLHTPRLLRYLLQYYFRGLCRKMVQADLVAQWPPCSAAAFKKKLTGSL